MSRIVCQFSCGAASAVATSEVVPSNSPQWRDECLARWQRVVSMRPMSIFARRAMLDEVQAKEGPEARRRLEVEFEKDWKARKGATT